MSRQLPISLPILSTSHSSITATCQGNLQYHCPSSLPHTQASQPHANATSNNIARPLYLTLKHHSHMPRQPPISMPSPPLTHSNLPATCQGNVQYHRRLCFISHKSFTLPSEGCFLNHHPFSPIHHMTNMFIRDSIVIIVYVVQHNVYHHSELQHHFHNIVWALSLLYII